MRFGEVVDAFLDLFEGRFDVVGVEDSGYGHPGPLAVGSRNEWRSHAQRHLRGEMNMGVYPVQQDHVLWGCVDFDDGEMESRTCAANVTLALAHLDITGWIERSRSKGYHVWVFAEDWVPAWTMRKALLAACQAVDAPTREINPKSEHLDPEEYGNYVRLPFYGAATGRLERQVVLHPQTLRPLSLPVWLSNVERDATRERLDTLAEWWEEPLPKVVRRLAADDADAPPWIERLGPKARSFVRSGPTVDRDRSGYLMATANAVAADGLSLDEVKEAVRYADYQFTQKFTHRRDAERRYEQMAEKAIAWTLLETTL